MTHSWWYCFVFAACLNGCEYSTPPVSCPPSTTIEVEARPGALQSDGALMVYGAIRLEAVLVEGEQPAATSERTVDALYVGYLEVQLAADGFNFRTWSVNLPADRLAAFTTTMSDGSRQAQLPVRVYVDGSCVMDMPQARMPIIRIPDPG